MGEPVVASPAAATALVPLHVSGGPSPDELAAALAVLATRRGPGAGSPAAYAQGAGANGGFAGAWRLVRRRALACRDRRLDGQETITP